MAESEVKYYVNKDGLRKTFELIDNYFYRKTDINELKEKISKAINNAEADIGDCRSRIFDNQQAIANAKAALSSVYHFSGTKSWGDIQTIIDILNGFGESYPNYTIVDTIVSDHSKYTHEDRHFTTGPGRSYDKELDETTQDGGIANSQLSDGNMYSLYSLGSVFNLLKEVEITDEISNYFVDFWYKENGKLIKTDISVSSDLTIKAGVNIAISQNPYYNPNLAEMDDEDLLEYLEQQGYTNSLGRESIKFLLKSKYLLDILGNSINFDAYFEKTTIPESLGKADVGEEFITKAVSLDTLSLDADLFIPLAKIGQCVTDDSVDSPFNQAQKFVDTDLLKSEDGKIDIIKVLKALVLNSNETPSIPLSNNQVEAIWSEVFQG